MQAVHQPPDASKIHVAVVDDDPDFLAYMEDFLTEEGRYRVSLYSRGAEFLKTCEKDPPDILLLDMKMGDIQGEEVLKEVQQRLPGVCVIVITGYPSLESMRATFRLKVFDYLAKPFSLAQLRQLLRNAEEAYKLGPIRLEEFRRQLGHQLRLRRVDRGWSLKQLSAATGISISQLSSIERGAHFPSLEALVMICRALGCRPSEVLSAVNF